MGLMDPEKLCTKVERDRKINLNNEENDNLTDESEVKVTNLSHSFEIKIKTENENILGKSNEINLKVNVSNENLLNSVKEKRTDSLVNSSLNQTNKKLFSISIENLLNGEFISTRNDNVLDAAGENLLNITSKEFLNIANDNVFASADENLLNTVSKEFLNSTTVHVLNAAHENLLNTSSKEFFSTIDNVLDAADDNLLNTENKELFFTTSDNVIDATTENLLNTKNKDLLGSTKENIFDDNKLIKSDRTNVEFEIRNDIFLNKMNEVSSNTLNVNSSSSPDLNESSPNSMNETFSNIGIENIPNSINKDSSDTMDPILKNEESASCTDENIPISMDEKSNSTSEILSNSSNNTCLELNVINDILDESIEIFNKSDQVKSITDDIPIRCNSSKTDVEIDRYTSHDLVSFDNKIENNLYKNIDLISQDLSSESQDSREINLSNPDDRLTIENNFAIENENIENVNSNFDCKENILLKLEESNSHLEFFDVKLTNEFGGDGNLSNVAENLNYNKNEDCKSDVGETNVLKFDESEILSVQNLESKNDSNTSDLINKTDNLIKYDSKNSINTSSTLSPLESDSESTSYSNSPEIKPSNIGLTNECIILENDYQNIDSNIDYKLSKSLECELVTSDNRSTYLEPAVMELSETDTEERHDCFNNSNVKKLKEEYEENKELIKIYKEKSDRLDDCLVDLEEMFDKVGLLEKKICQYEMELDISRQEKDKECKSFNAYKQETSAHLESLKKKYEQANKEKEGMTIRYAKSEKELLDMKKEKATLLKQIKDQHKENENILAKLKHLSDDKSRLAQALDNKNMELSAAFKDMEKLKEDINARDIKVKWIQNKLLAEMDLHKECPEQIENLNSQILELEKKLEKNREDIEQYKKSVQELEAIKVLEGQVREEQAKLILERHDQSERVIKMKALQLKTDSLIEENNNLSFQVQNLEVERLDLEKRLSESRQESQEYANHLADLKSKLVQFDSISNQLTQERERLEKANEEVERLRKANEELMQDMSTCRSREAEMLSFTQKLTTKNVQLQSEFSSIESRAGELMLEAEKAESASDNLRKQVDELKQLLNHERSKREEERNLLAREVAEGRSKISSLESQLNETKSNLHTSNNKHQALIRELQRELQTCHRKLEQEGKVHHNSSHVDNSCVKQLSSGPDSTGRSSPGDSSSLTSSLNSIPDATIVQPSHLQLEVSPAILVERILKLQTDAKNYQDKIEFLEDHNTTLLEELKKKGRLLHSYILREQAGALSSQASDKHKMEVSKHGGIMSSVYGSKATDEGMTLELSLQINHKLQAILEDTLLKNITLKENIDTLGDEIARLKRSS